jgi:hypothetical protein
MCWVDHARNRRARRAVVHAIENATDPAAHPTDTAASIMSRYRFRDEF